MTDSAKAKLKAYRAWIAGLDHWRICRLESLPWVEYQNVQRESQWVYLEPNDKNNKVILISHPSYKVIETSLTRIKLTLKQLTPIRWGDRVKEGIQSTS